MYDLMVAHEKFMMEALQKESYAKDFLAHYHYTQIQFIQHERFIHLIVTLFFAFLLVCCVAGSLAAPTPLFFLLDLILVILLAFYIRHYYRLENGLERWYKIYNQIIL